MKSTNRHSLIYLLEHAPQKVSPAYFDRMLELARKEQVRRERIERGLSKLFRRYLTALGAK